MIEIDGEFFEDYTQRYKNEMILKKAEAITKITCDIMKVLASDITWFEKFVQLEVLKCQRDIVMSQPIFPKFETGGIVLDPIFK